MSAVKYQKPFLKWAGGKTQILSQVLSKVPKTMENYHEIFLGGGSLLLSLKPDKAFCYELNEHVIDPIIISQKVCSRIYKKNTNNSRLAFSRLKTFNILRINLQTLIYFIRYLFERRSCHRCPNPDRLP